ncbi:MAG: alpha-galactosidase [Clostridia bacterium]|nr:alpha-galactosidase [Clostridia bacterium]
MTCYQNSQADGWYRQLLQDTTAFPFFYTYGGVRYAGFSPTCLIGRETSRDGERETAVLRYQISEALVATLKLTHSYAYGVTEWTVYFHNPSQRNSELLAAAETQLRFAGESPVLKGILGDHVNQYRPYSISLTEMPVRFTSESGRATHVSFPYFNLEHGTGGSMLAIGWAGTWTADFRYENGETVYTARSVNNLCTYLKPGETIRTALFVRADYTVRRESYATNYWRSWFIAENLPKEDASGKPLAPFSTCCLASDTGLPNSDGSISERHTTWRPSLEKMIEENVKVDFRWFDAGWYTSPDKQTVESDWWNTIGTWVLDPEKWPGESFRESTDFAREHGMRTLMWFEPERVTNPAALAENFGYREEWGIRCNAIDRYETASREVVTNNIGDPACFAWTLKQVTDTLRRGKVEMYREDNNSNPGELWRYLDTVEGEGRTGITESRFIDAHYRLWDGIIDCTLSYGGCGFVDSCASGGGRNDLESMRRGVPLLRSDSDRTTTGLRLSMTTAFNKWIPFCGANTKEKTGELALTGRTDPYTWRASYLPALNVDSQFVQDPDQDFDILRFGLSEWKKLSPYLLKDLYVLTPWHAERDTYSFTALAYFDEETRRGALLAFRQENCPASELSLSLPFVPAGATVCLTDEDSGEAITVCAQAEGAALTLCFAEPRSARLLWIEVK